MALRCHRPFSGWLSVIGLQALRAAGHPAHVFCKAFKACKGMSLCGSSEKPSVCKLRKTTRVPFAFLSCLNVTTSTRTSSCLNRSLNFSEWSAYVLQTELGFLLSLHRDTHFPLLPLASW